MAVGYEGQYQGVNGNWFTPDPYAAAGGGGSASSLASIMGGGGNLAQNAASQNLAAMPQLQSLSTLINQINKTANESRVTGGAGLEAQSSANIANELAGNLPQDFLTQLQTGIAQRSGRAGFGANSSNANAAALRAMGLSSIDMQDRGQRNLTAAYNRAAPLWSVQEGMVTPALAEQQQYHTTQAALENQAQQYSSSQARAALAEQQRQFDIEQNKYAGMSVGGGGVGRGASSNQIVPTQTGEPSGYYAQNQVSTPVAARDPNEAAIKQSWAEQEAYDAALVANRNAERDALHAQWKADSDREAEQIAKYLAKQDAQRRNYSASVRDMNLGLKDREEIKKANQSSTASDLAAPWSGGGSGYNPEWVAIDNAAQAAQAAKNSQASSYAANVMAEMDAISRAIAAAQAQAAAAAAARDRANSYTPVYGYVPGASAQNPNDPFAPLSTPVNVVPRTWRG